MCAAPAAAPLASRKAGAKSAPASAAACERAAPHKVADVRDELYVALVELELGERAAGGAAPTLHAHDAGAEGGTDPSTALEGDCVARAGAHVGRLLLMQYRRRGEGWKRRVAEAEQQADRLALGKPRVGPGR